MRLIDARMQDSRHVSLSTDGQEQGLTISHEFALPGAEAILRKKGQRLVIAPISSKSLLSVLTTLRYITDNFPDIDETLLPIDDIAL